MAGWPEMAGVLRTSLAFSENVLAQPCRISRSVAMKGILRSPWNCLPIGRCSVFWLAMTLWRPAKRQADGVLIQLELGAGFRAAVDQLHGAVRRHAVAQPLRLSDQRQRRMGLPQLRNR